MEGPDGFEGVGAEKAKKVEAICGEGVVEFEGGLPTGEPTDNSVIYLKTSEHLANLRKLASVKVR